MFNSFLAISSLAFWYPGSWGAPLVSINGFYAERLKINNYKKDGTKMSNLNLNKVIIAGRLTADPELKLTQTGLSVVSFSVAVNRPARVVNNQRVAESDFISCVAWRNAADFIAKYFKKGSAICLTGSLQSRTWSDNNGVKHYATELVVDDTYFVDGKSDNKVLAPIPEAYGSPTFTNGANVPDFEEIKDDEELPL